MLMKLRVRWTAALCVLMAVSTAQAGAKERKVTVLAAASLTESVGEIAETYEAKTGVKVQTSFAASSTLARQIEASAPADVFISADDEWMDYLASRGLIINDSRTDLLANHLVLIAPAGSKTSIKIFPHFGLAEALGSGRLSLGDPDYVPAGKYALQSLTKLSVWDEVVGKLLRGDSVRSALALVAVGTAPLGIVYTTDAMAEPKVRIVDTFPDDTHLPIVYPVAALKGSGGEAAGFIAYLKSPEAASVFTKRGFVVLGKTAQ